MRFLFNWLPSGQSVFSWVTRHTTALLLARRRRSALEAMVLASWTGLQLLLPSEISNAVSAKIPASRMEQKESIVIITVKISSPMGFVTVTCVGFLVGRQRAWSRNCCKTKQAIWALSVSWTFTTYRNHQWMIYYEPWRARKVFCSVLKSISVYK